MNNKPKIHATCKAGCLWETIHKSDFEKSASHVIQYANDNGNYVFELGKEYKIFAPKNAENQFTCSVIFAYSENGANKTHEITFTNYDQYEEYFTFRLLEAIKNSESEIKIVYEIAGLRYAEGISGTNLTLLTKDYCYVSGASEVLLFNVDATITLEPSEDDEDMSNYYTKDEIDALLNYKEIDIINFMTSPTTFEKGSTVSSVTLSWLLNKTPVEQKLDSEIIDVSARIKTLTGLSLNSDKTYTLTAKDEKGATDTATVTIRFYNGVYYGVAENQNEYSNEFIRNLPKSLQGSKSKTFTVTAGAGQYIYYAVPTSYGDCSFTVGGFEGGFSKVSTLYFTNESGYSENYDIYMSDNANLGNTTVTVK